MQLKKIGLVVALVAGVLSSGCATYRTSSNITSEPTSPSKLDAKIIISEGSLPDKKYKELGPIEVSVKKLTIFNKDPTKEMVNEALTEKARGIGADAVINVIYKSGVGFTTWGYMDGKGTGVKFAE
jgi:hypothetical protein